MNVGAVVRGIASLSWIAVILVVGLAVMRAARGQPFRRAIGWVITALLVAVLTTTASAGLVFLQPEERGGVISGAPRTADGQEVVIDASVIYSVDPNKIINVHIQWKNRFETDLVRPQARGIIRDEASRFRVDEIVSE